MIVVGLDQIGKLFGGKSRWTVARYIKKHGLCARRLPGGVWCTSLSHVAAWIERGYKADSLVCHEATTYRPRQPQRPSTTLRRKNGAGRSNAAVVREAGAGGALARHPGRTMGDTTAAADSPELGKGPKAGTERPAPEFFE